MARLDDAPLASLATRPISRRAFLELGAAMAAVLALPAAYAPRVAAAVEASPRIPVVWLHGQGCGGDTEAFLRSADPTAAELLFDVLSVDFDAALMADTGSAAWDRLTQTIAQQRDAYFLVVEGSIPQGADGAYAAMAGRTFRDVVRMASEGAVGVMALGSCATDGGIVGAGGGPTDAVGLASIVSSDRLIALPGCPVNPANLTATIVHYVTFKELPPTDGQRRPLFAYGALLHNQCERRAHFEFGEFVLAWGDEGAQKGWCLYKMGCKGPETYANCPTVRYGEGTGWAVRAGHGCVGCTMPGSWDAMSPYYRRLPAPVPFLPHLTADHVGAALVGGIAAVTVVHGTASYVRSRRGGPGHGQPPAETPPAETTPAETTPAETTPTETTPAEAMDGETAPAAAPIADLEARPATLEPPPSERSAIEVPPVQVPSIESSPVPTTADAADDGRVEP